MIIKTLFLLFPTLLFLVPLVGYKSNRPQRVIKTIFHNKLLFTDECIICHTLKKIFIRRKKSAALRTFFEILKITRSCRTSCTYNIQYSFCDF